MRLIALFVAVCILLTACMGSGDDADVATEVPASPTTSEVAPEPEQPRPTATEVDEPTATSEPTPTSEPEPTEEPEPSPTSETPADTGDLAAQIDQIAQETSVVRQLDLLEALNSQIITRDQLGQNMITMIEEDYGREQADLDRDLLWMLRLIPDRSLDYYQLQIDLLTEQVAGYYDPETGELFVISDNPELSIDQRVTMSHEITHAIQDQHFGLDRFEDDDTDFDASTAFSAVVEGDATWTMVQWAVEFLTMAELSEFLTESATGASTEVFDNAPRYVRDGLTFPYEAGFQFIEQLVRTGGNAAVDAALADPPVSTEQILHPEKYINEPRDLPLEVVIPDLVPRLGDGWQETYQGTLGEFDLMILLEENGVADSHSATEGWGGTRFAMYASGDDRLTVLSTRWDTPEDATEFDEALRETMSSYELDGDIWTDGERYFAIITDNDRVVLTTSTSRDALQAALNGQQVLGP